MIFIANKRKRMKRFRSQKMNNPVFALYFRTTKICRKAALNAFQARKDNETQPEIFITLKITAVFWKKRVVQEMSPA